MNTICAEKNDIMKYRFWTPGASSEENDNRYDTRQRVNE